MNVAHVWEDSGVANTNEWILLSLHAYVFLEAKSAVSCFADTFAYIYAKIKTWNCMCIFVILMFCYIDVKKAT